MSHAVPRRLVLAAAAATALPVRAQAFPSRPIRLLVGFAPGGAVDIIARACAASLAATLGQPVVVENRPGAGTNLAMRALVDSAPDGHTLMLTANSVAANPALYQPPPLDPVRDITPVSLVGRVPVVIAANAAGGPESIGRLIAASRAAPRSVTYGSPGNGSTPHLAVALFARAAGIELTHVPYKGGAPAINDVIAGHVQTVAVNALEVQPHVKSAPRPAEPAVPRGDLSRPAEPDPLKSGRLRVLAVLTPARTPIFPDAPTIAESGFAGFEASVWYGFIGPAALPAPVVQALHAAVQKAIASAEVRERIVGAGGEVQPGPVERLTQLIASESARYAALIREAGIKPD